MVSATYVRTTILIFCQRRKYRCVSSSLQALRLIPNQPNWQLEHLLQLGTPFSDNLAQVAFAAGNRFRHNVSERVAAARQAFVGDTSVGKEHQSVRLASVVYDDGLFTPARETGAGSRKVSSRWIGRQTNIKLSATE